jgi:copper resistance protein C
MTISYQTGPSWLPVLLSVALGLLVGSPQASAHAKMNKTVPADGASVAPGLAEIRFAFTDAIRITLVKVTQQESKVTVPPASKLTRTFVTEAKIAFEPLTPGTYAVMWTGVGSDGHVMKGAFSFSVISPIASQPDTDAH